MLPEPESVSLFPDRFIHFMSQYTFVSILLLYTIIYIYVCVEKHLNKQYWRVKAKMSKLNLVPNATIS